MKFKAFHSLLLIPFLVFQLVAQEGGLRVTVIAGDGQFVDIHRRINPEPAVEVRDASGRAVEGATVTFFIPPDGPGGTFANGTTTRTVTTDREGRAIAAGIHPNNNLGKYEIRVVASYHGQTGNATITETNVAGSSSSGGASGGGGGGFSRRAWIILAISVGVAGAGAALALRGGSSKSPNTGIVLTPGTPTVGAPQ
jgi:hypothetical protein